MTALLSYPQWLVSGQKRRKLTFKATATVMTTTANKAAVQSANRASQNQPLVYFVFPTAYDCFCGSV